MSGPRPLSIDAGDMYETFWDPTAPGPYSLIDQEGNGLAIWHIDESRMSDYRTAVEMEPAVGQTNPIQWHNYLYDATGSLWGKDFWDNSTGSNARWHDGGTSQIGVWAIPPSGTAMRVLVICLCIGQSHQTVVRPDA